MALKSQFKEKADFEDLTMLLQIGFYVRKFNALESFYNEVHDLCVEKRQYMSYEKIEEIRNIITRHGVLTESIFFVFNNTR